MLARNLKDTFDTLRGEAKFLRMVVLGLIVANLFVSCVAISRDQVVTVVPPTLAEQSWVSKTKAGEEYTEAWAMYIAMLLGNVTPSNATVVKDALGPILDSGIYQDVMEVLDHQIFLIRQDRVSLGFEPQKVLRDNANPNKFFVVGRSVSEGPIGEKKRQSRTYEMELVIRNYRPLLSWLNTYSGEARSQDVIDRETKMNERMDKLHNKTE